jgi:ferredoxin
MAKAGPQHQAPVNGPPDAPPAFQWPQWYQGAGGRQIAIREIDDLMRQIFQEQVPRFQGPVAASQHAFATGADAASFVKRTALSLGADMVGICELAPSDLYRGREVPHRYAIALGKAMRYREFQSVPTEHSAIESVRIYHDLGEICIGLADALRAEGWSAQVEHPLGDADIMHLPVAIKAGLGELGRHGSLIHPQFGPLVRLGAVLTSMPLKIDQPVDLGIGALCDRCKACRIYCPAGAIPDQRDPSAGTDPQGNARYVVDTGRCFSYFARHNYCSACLPVCVYNHKEWARDFQGRATRGFPEVLMQPPPEPVDSVPAADRHRYPRIGRDGHIEAAWRLKRRAK